MVFFSRYVLHQCVSRIWIENGWKILWISIGLFFVFHSNTFVEIWQNLQIFLQVFFCVHSICFFSSSFEISLSFIQECHHQEPWPPQCEVIYLTFFPFFPACASFFSDWSENVNLKYLSESRTKTRADTFLSIPFFCECVNLKSNSDKKNAYTLTIDNEKKKKKTNWNKRHRGKNSTAPLEVFDVSHLID